MLVITCDMYYLRGTWWSRGHLYELQLCDDELRKVFRIPRDLGVMTMALYTTPAKERVRVRVCRDKGFRYVETYEHGVYDTWRGVPNWIWRAIRKYEGKPLYLEVTY